MARRNENAALVMLERVGADKAYDTKDFVAACRNMEISRRHVAQNVKRSGGSAIEEWTTRHAGYAVKRS
jgi:hypothetical protein